MATEKYRKAVREVMDHVRSMSDEEFLEIIRSQNGDLGVVFGMSESASIATSETNLTYRSGAVQHIMEFADDVEYYSSLELSYYNAANDAEYLLAA